MAPLPPTRRMVSPRPWWLRLPLLAASLAFLGGVAWGSRAPWPWKGTLAAAGALLLLAELGRRRQLRGAKVAASVWRLAALFLLGVARYRLALPDLQAPDHIVTYRDTHRTVVVVGVLLADPDLRAEHANLRLATQRIRFADEVRHRPVHGTVLVQAPLPAARPLRYGDQIVVRGQLQTPPSGRTFSYREHLARQGIYGLLDASQVGLLARNQGHPLRAQIYRWRRRALAQVNSLWPQPEAGLLAGILLGEDHAIPPDLYRAFRDTGTAHIIAISGFNITLIAGVVIALLGRVLGPGWGSLVAAGVIGGYTLLVGADAAVVRAALMGSLALLARQGQRPPHPYTALASAGAMMALWDPRILGDVGFQLSFAATWGLMRFAEPLARRAHALLRAVLGARPAQRVLPFLHDAVLLTLAAQLTTLPIVAFHFHRLSLVSLIANPIILWAQGPLMLSSGLALMLALIWPPLGRLAAPLAWPWAAYTIRAVQHFGALPWSALAVGHFGLSQVLLYYAGLLGAPRLPALWSRASGRLRAAVLRPLTLLLLLASGAALLAHEALIAPDGRLHLWLLDTRGGQTLLIRTPSGQHVLLNGGADPLALQDALGRHLPLLGTPLDALIVASADPEDLRGLTDLLARYRPRQIFWPWPEARLPPSLHRLRAQAEAHHLSITPLSPGAALVLSPQITFDLLQGAPRGSLWRLRYHHFVSVWPFLPWQGAEAELEALPPTVFLLAGHGKGGWNDALWIRRHPPTVLLLAVSPPDQPGLPSPALLQALQGFPILRTDLYGTIHLSTDGRRLWVSHESASP